MIALSFFTSILKTTKMWYILKGRTSQFNKNIPVPNLAQFGSKN